MLYKDPSYANVVCQECGEAIYNPLCPFCISGEVDAWLENKDKDTKKTVKREIKKILGRGEHLISESVRCVSCNRNSAFLCPYCFTEILFYRLEENKVSKKLLKEFVVFFDFDFEH